MDNLPDSISRSGCADIAAFHLKACAVILDSQDQSFVFDPAGDREAAQYIFAVKTVSRVVSHNGLQGQLCKVAFQLSH